MKTCDACAKTTCVPLNTINGVTTPSTSKSAASTAGAIAGGVIGGIIFVAIIVYLFWRFWLKKRIERQREEEEEEEAAEKANEFSMRRDARASTQTVGTVASTSTRTSNIIQIAYIPGVTNRSIESTPDLAPPVPPIPAASLLNSSTSSPRTEEHDQHYFLPNFRDSTLSGYSDASSLAPRIAPQAAYRNATRAKATAISVKTPQNNSPSSASGSSSPPRLPSLRLQSQPSLPTLSTKSSIVGRMEKPKQVTVVRSPSGRNANAPPPRQQPPPMPPHNIYELSGDESSNRSIAHIAAQQRILANDSPQYGNDSSTFDDGSTTSSSSDEEEPVRARRSLMGHDRTSNATTVIQDSPAVEEAMPLKMGSNLSPNALMKKEARDRKKAHKKSRSLNQIIEEATRRARSEPKHGLVPSMEDAEEADSPFTDRHMARTP